MTRFKHTRCQDDTGIAWTVFSNSNRGRFVKGALKNLSLKLAFQTVEFTLSNRKQETLLSILFEIQKLIWVCNSNYPENGKSFEVQNWFDLWGGGGHLVLLIDTLIDYLFTYHKLARLGDHLGEILTISVHETLPDAVAYLGGTPGPNFSHFMHFFEILAKSHVGAPWRVGAPSYRESWIRPWDTMSLYDFMTSFHSRDLLPRRWLLHC